MTGYDNNPSPYLRQSVSDNPYRLIEWTTFLETLGPVTGLSVLDVACGDGRLTRILAHGGARRVVGVDISSEMIARARAHNAAGEPEAFPDRVVYQVVSAAADLFALEEKVDVVTAMYLFHYAADVDELAAMGRFIARNLRPGGRFVTYTINPEYQFGNAPADMEARIGFRYVPVAPPAYELVIGEFHVPMWQWSAADHEAALAAAGLVDVAWHPLEVPAGRADVRDAFAWYLANPSLIVLSARKPG